MFIQGLFYVVIAIVAAICIWKWVIKPMLIGTGIEEDVPPSKKEVLTAYERDRNLLKEKLKSLQGDVVAAEEMVDIKKESIEIIARLNELDEKIKELSK